MMDRGKLEVWDKKYIWHPFTQMKDWFEEDIVIIERGEGEYLYDINGKRYIDGVSSLWVNLHGHNHPRINEAIKAQIDKISHSTLLGLANVPSIELAKRLVELAPSRLTRVFYSDSGSEGVEIALKIAYQYWRNKGEERNTFIHLKNSYHGDTIGAVSVGGIELFHAIYGPLLFKTYAAPSPYCYRCEFSLEPDKCGFHCLEEMERILAEHAGEIAGVILEPLVQAAGGIIVHPPSYLKGVEKLCRKYNTLLILDEVAVGFGRTGCMFACQNEDVEPDIMVVAKGLTGGYLPLAGTLVSEEIFSAFLGEYHEQKTFYHGHTYTGNQLCCAAALANLEIFEEEKTLEKLKGKIALLSSLLDRFPSLEHVGDVRQCGFIAGIELVKDKESKEPYPWEERVGAKVCFEARKYGLLIRPLGDVIVIIPPLSISERNLEYMLDVIYQCIKEVTE